MSKGRKARLRRSEGKNVRRLENRIKDKGERQRTDDGSQNSEYRSQEIEDGRQRTEGGGQAKKIRRQEVWKERKN